MVDIDTTNVDTTDDVSSVNINAPLDGARIPELLLGKPHPVSSKFLFHQLMTTLPRMLSDLLAIGMVATAVMIAGWSTQFLYSMLAASAALLLAFAGTGQYPGVGVHPAIALRRSTITCGVIACTMLTVALANATVTSNFLLQWAIVWGLITILVPLLRYLKANLLKNCDWWAQPVLILGNDYVAGSVYRALDANRKSGLRPLGIVVDASSQWEDSNIDPGWVLGTLDEISVIKQKHDVFWVVNTVQPESAQPGLNAIAQHASSLFPIRLLMIGGHDTQLSILDSFVSLDRFTLVKQTDRLLLPIHRLAKRFSDIVLSIILIILLSPLIVALAIAIRVNSRGSIFFKSPRIGTDGSEFLMTKFRSMYINGDEILARYLAKYPDKLRLYEQNVKLENDPRVTPIGNLMRRTSLDELPQLFDVLRGNMSLVGPRPMLPDEKAKYGDVIQKYQRMLPGITGLWQVSGRNNTSYEQRLQCVNYYVQNWSPWLDVCILAKTTLVVMKKEGAY